MRPVVLQMGVTLDGYVAGPGGEGDWGLPAEHPDVRAWKIASLRRVGTHIMGRVTYEQMAAYWPTATGDYASFMNNLPKVVFSKTLPAADWADSRVARGDLAEEIAALKSLGIPCGMPVPGQKLRTSGPERSARCEVQAALLAEPQLG